MALSGILDPAIPPDIAMFPELMDSSMRLMCGCAVWCSGMQDLFAMMQSKTFVQQIGYELLEIGVVNMFPELKPLFRQMERGAL